MRYLTNCSRVTSPLLAVSISLNQAGNGMGALAAGGAAGVAGGVAGAIGFCGAGAAGGLLGEAGGVWAMAGSVTTAAASRIGPRKRLIDSGLAYWQGEFVSAAMSRLSTTSALRHQAATQSRPNEGVMAIGLLPPFGSFIVHRVSTSEKGRKYLGGKGNFAGSAC